MRKTEREIERERERKKERERELSMYDVDQISNTNFVFHGVVHEVLRVNELFHPH